MAASLRNWERKKYRLSKIKIEQVEASQTIEAFGESLRSFSSYAVGPQKYEKELLTLA